MFSDANILLVTAASIAFIHTILGPDHYLVFVAMAKARGWSLAKALRVTSICGLGHVLSSVLIGALGILLGSKLTKLVAIESSRGNLAGWALLAFGLVYLAWAIKQLGRNHRHAHAHRHGDLVHTHEHDHRHEHAHPHDEINGRSGGISITPWALFIVFVLGPCEALIPLLMYPAAQQSGALVMSVALVFGVVTIATMLGAVALALFGLNRVRFRGLERYSQVIAGASIVACGGAINFAGL